jgi:hypothetical protein
MDKYLTLLLMHIAKLLGGKKAKVASERCVNREEGKRGLDVYFWSPIRASQRCNDEW